MRTDAGREARRRQRASTWDGGRTALADADEADARFWSKVPGGERLQATWELAWEWYGDTTEPAGGLRRAPHGVRRR